MCCVRVMLIVFVILGGVISSAPPVIADPENAYVRRNLVVNRHDPTDPSSPPPAAITDPLFRNPWGAAIRSAGLGGHFWLANAASATVTTYIGDSYDESGHFVPLYQDELKSIAVEGPPIGQVFSSSDTDFPVTGLLCTDDGIEVYDTSQGDTFLGKFTGPSRFIVATGAYMKIAIYATERALVHAEPRSPVPDLLVKESDEDVHAWLARIKPTDFCA
jgi:hypothetical protein